MPNCPLRAAEIAALIARHVPWLDPGNTRSTASTERAEPAATIGLQLREFDSYPALAAWCLDRVPPTESGHFAMGYGRAFVSLLELMHADPRRPIRLLAISETGGSSNRLRCVLACQKEEPGSSDSPAVTVVLYEQGDRALISTPA